MQSPFCLELPNIAKPKLLLLHGLGMGHRMWTPQFEALGEHYHLIVPDLPGLARSKKCGAFSLEESASILLKTLDHKSLFPLHICGLSLGVMVALELTLQAEPNAVQSLILSAGQVKASRLIMSIQQIVFNFMPEKRLIKTLPSSIPSADEKLRSAAKEDAELTGKDGFLQALRSVADADFTTKLSEVTPKTLVLCGMKDKPNIGAARALAKGIPNAELRLIEDAGHVWNIEHPALFNATVTEFINAN